MYIESLELENYRNYKNLNITFDKDKNIIYGDNAQVKTNILESLYYCGTTKSHRGSRDRDVINFDENVRVVGYHQLFSEHTWMYN